MIQLCSIQEFNYFFSEKAIGKADRELLRYQKERERMEEQLRVANDDVANISMVNVELKSEAELFVTA